MYNVGLIRVVSIFDEKFLNSHGKIIEKNYPNINVESLAIEDQPKGIHNNKTEELAIPKIIDLAKKNFSMKDAVIISCAGDPALDILRNEMDIPIIGAGESAALISKLYGEKVGVVGITKELPKSYQKILGVNIIGKPYIEGINSTLDLMEEEGKTKVINHCKELKNLGAKVLVFACTGLSTMKFAPIIERKVGLKVIDCVYAESVMAYGACIRKDFYNEKSN